MRWVWSILLCSILIIPGCAEEEKNEKTIKVGSLLSVTGGLAGIGQDLLAASQMAVDEINAAGGILGGQKLKLVNRDEGSDTAKAKVAAQAHLDDGIQALVGAIGSAFTLGSADILTAGKVVMVSPSSTSPDITGYNDGGFLFRTVPSDALQGKLLAQKALAAGYATAAVTHVTGAYGKGLADTFKAEFEAGGGTVAFFEEYKDGESSYTDLLTRAFATSPDCFLMAVYPQEGGQMLADLNTGFANQDAFIYLADAAANEEFITLAGGQAAFSFPHLGTAPSSEGPNYAAFAAAYKAIHGKDPGIFQANAYDAVYLIALAMEAGGANDATKIRDALPAVSAGGEAYGPTEFKAAIEAIGKGEDIDYTGASGNVDLDSAGDTVAPYALWKVENGAVTVTGTESPN